MLGYITVQAQCIEVEVSFKANTEAHAPKNEPSLVFQKGEGSCPQSISKILLSTAAVEKVLDRLTSPTQSWKKEAKGHRGVARSDRI